MERRLHGDLAKSLTIMTNKLLELIRNALKSGNEESAVELDHIFARMSQPIREFYYKNDTDQELKIRFCNYLIEKIFSNGLCLKSEGKNAKQIFRFSEFSEIFHIFVFLFLINFDFGNVQKVWVYHEGEGGCRPKHHFLSRGEGGSKASITWYSDREIIAKFQIFCLFSLKFKQKFQKFRLFMLRF